MIAVVAFGSICELAISTEMFLAAVVECQWYMAKFAWNDVTVVNWNLTCLNVEVSHLIMPLCWSVIVCKHWNFYSMPKSQLGWINGQTVTVTKTWRQAVTELLCVKKNGKKRILRRDICRMKGDQGWRLCGSRWLNGDGDNIAGIMVTGELKTLVCSGNDFVLSAFLNFKLA